MGWFSSTFKPGGGGSAARETAARAAAAARAAEAKRVADIAQGQANIDDQFAGFNDDFYNKYQTDYNNYYNPQAEDQYADARKRLTLQLASTGNLTSSSGAEQIGNLQEHYNNQRTGITNKGINNLNDLRSNIDTSKSQLYADNRSAADPARASEAAFSAISSLQPAQQDSPLANVFTDFFQNAGNSAAAYNNSRNYNQNNGVQNYNNSGNNSVKYYGQ